MGEAPCKKKELMRSKRERRAAEPARESPHSNFAARRLPRTPLLRNSAAPLCYAPVPRRLVVGLKSEDGADVGDVIPACLKVVDQLDDG